MVFMREFRFSSDDGGPLKAEYADIDAGGFPLHTHDFLELVVILAGSGVHAAAGYAFPLRTGDVFVIHEGETHGFTDCRVLRMINIAFKRDLLAAAKLRELHALTALIRLEPELRRTTGYTSRLHLGTEGLSNLAAAAEEIRRELKRRLPGYELKSRSLFLSLLVDLARFYDTDEFPAGRALSGITAAAARIEREYAGRLDLDALAAEAGFSPSRFRRRFREVFGVTPLRFLQRERLSAAARELRRSDDSITEIAFRSGFDDSNYFSRLFRRETGSSPRQYRRIED